MHDAHPDILQPTITRHADGTLESITPCIPLKSGGTVAGQMHVRIEQDRVTIAIRFHEWHPRLHALCFATPDQLAARLPLPVPLAARFLSLLIIQAAEERERTQFDAS